MSFHAGTACCHVGFTLPLRNVSVPATHVLRSSSIPGAYLLSELVKAHRAPTGLRSVPIWPEVPSLEPASFVDGRNKNRRKCSADSQGTMHCCCWSSPTCRCGSEPAGRCEGWSHLGYPACRLISHLQSGALFVFWSPLVLSKTLSGTCCHKDLPLQTRMQTHASQASTVHKTLLAPLPSLMK